MKKMEMVKKAAMVMTAAVMVCGLTACGSAAEGEGAEGGEVITFGTNAEFPPFEFVTSNGVIGQYDGIDMAIAKKIA